MKHTVTFTSLDRPPLIGEWYLDKDDLETFSIRDHPDDSMFYGDSAYSREESGVPFMEQEGVREKINARFDPLG